MVKTKMAELAEGMNVGHWLAAEVPGWRNPYDEEPYRKGISTYTAASPTYDKDGIKITADSPEELVERIRMFERMLAMLQGRNGRLPVGGMLAGVEVDHVNGAPVVEPVAQRGQEDVTPVKPRPEPKPDPTLQTQSMSQQDMARLQGFTGDVCPRCGGLRMVRTGKCAACSDCGESNSCS
jgi:hypothetical protein